MAKKSVKKIKDNKKEKEELSYLKLLEHPFAYVPRTIGQRAADSLTKWAGSWTFIILFLVFLMVWIFTNGYFLLQFIKSGTIEDPFPFILLNLVLSCIAAIQAPIILMSQNRENQRDRLRAKYDYAINRKAEKEIQEIKKILLGKKRK